MSIARLMQLWALCNALAIAALVVPATLGN